MKCLLFDPGSSREHSRAAVVAALIEINATDISRSALPRQLRRRRRAPQLGLGDVAPHRRHAAVGAGDDPLLRHELQGLADHRRDLLGRLDRVGGDVDDADQHVLAVEQRQQSSGTCELMHSSETWSIAALGERRKDLLVLPPLAAERVLPVDIGLDAVAVADVHGGGAGEPAMARSSASMPQLGDLVHVTR